MDLHALADSCRYSGVFEILTCGCGVAGCAGIYEGIRVTHGDGIINWQVPRPFSWPTHKTLPKNITYTEFVFDKQQYVEAICNGIKEGKKLLLYEEEKHESVETGPCGFTTYDFFSLNITSSGFYSARINKALEFSAKAHLSQVRKGIDIPYITHPFAVGMILANAGCSEEIIVAGILHDTVEDTETTIEDIKAAFGEEVATIVAGCSE
ncbi:MAG: bifunctional (p)ppGpp synthetase/guanosine-3',5'-bis(diphosphate) 3'-pyrophosphohydrolase, partial [Deltaproteobacteria bacterium]|nr:bifunctional (p)ppGpp synthetase/guanosine-3',5'-bis(diphosphate) 3'-pyrophosphohydrolase [Deltaproteobacteria bacterium]